MLLSKEEMDNLPFLLEEYNQALQEFDHAFRLQGPTLPIPSFLEHAASDSSHLTMQHKINKT